MNKKRTKICTTSKYIEHVLNLASVVTRSVSISTFISLICIPIGITMCTITAGINLNFYGFNKSCISHN